MLKFSICTLLFLLAHNQLLIGQDLSPQQMQYVQKKAKLVQTSSNDYPANWKPLSKKLKGKKLVLLGEFTHGAKEIFENRNDLIHYLHKKMDFNVILFETGIGELLHPDWNRDTLSAGQMTNNLIGSWRTKEFKSLMGYVQKEDIAIAGFDVQRSGRSFQKILHEIAVEKNIDTALYVQLEQEFGRIQRKLRNRKTVYNTIAAPTQQLIADYKALHFEFIKKQANARLPKCLLVSKTLENRIAFMEYMLQWLNDKNWRQRWTARDSMMASNVRWLANHIYPNQKLIVIAHNFHIAHYNENEKVMGAFLKKKYGKDMYALGVLAGGGSYAGNSGNEKEMKPIGAEKLDLKHIIQKLEGFAHFISIPKKKKSKYNWLFEKIVVNDTFIDLNGSNEMELAKHFDGLLFLKTVSMPEK